MRYVEEEEGKLWKEELVNQCQPHWMIMYHCLLQQDEEERKQREAEAAKKKEEEGDAEEADEEFDDEEVWKCIFSDKSLYMRLPASLLILVFRGGG